MEEAHVEIEALRSIFEEELVVEDKETCIVVTKKVRPTDDENGPSASVICQFMLLEGYPNTRPEVELSRPRGLSEEDFIILQENVKDWLTENQGTPAIFDILQLCGDFFLSHQSSSELLCPICLCPLSSTASISTPCDHYLHKECMDKYITVTRKNIAADLQNPETRALHKEVDKALYCPVCRELVEEEIKPLYVEKKKGNPKQREQGHQDFVYDWDKWRREQALLEPLFKKQQQNGGIINLEEERQRHVITEETVIEIPTATGRPSSTLESTETAENAHTRQRRNNNHHHMKERRYHNNPPRNSKRSHVPSPHSTEGPSRDARK